MAQVRAAVGCVETRQYSLAAPARLAIVGMGSRGETPKPDMSGTWIQICIVELSCEVQQVGGCGQVGKRGEGGRGQEEQEVAICAVRVSSDQKEEMPMKSRVRRVRRIEAY